MSEDILKKKIVIGTRGSALALAQVDLVRDRLLELDSTLEIVTEVITTTGDLNPKVRDKKEWIDTIESALLDKKIDIAIHSAKDVPVEVAKGTVVHSILGREDARDAYISHKGIPYNQAKVIGTSSLRRREALKRALGEVEIREWRGNVPTRIKRLAEDPEVDGIVLACAGLLRLGLWDEKIMSTLNVDYMLPAVCQGIIAVQYNADSWLSSLLSKLMDNETQESFVAERSFIKTLGADCRSAVSVFAEVKAGTTLIRGTVYSTTTAESFVVKRNAAVGQAETLGNGAALELIEKHGCDSLVYK